MVWEGQDRCIDMPQAQFWVGGEASLDHLAGDVNACHGEVSFLGQLSAGPSVAAAVIEDFFVGVDPSPQRVAVNGVGKRFLCRDVVPVCCLKIKSVHDFPA